MQIHIGNEQEVTLVAKLLPSGGPSALSYNLRFEGVQFELGLNPEIQTSGGPTALS
jgi:hypothetical protein